MAALVARERSVVHVALLLPAKMVPRASRAKARVAAPAATCYLPPRRLRRPRREVIVAGGGSRDGGDELPAPLASCRRFFRATLLVAPLALAACGGGGLAGALRSSGVTSTPDEFMVLPTRPLEMPDSFAALPTADPGRGQPRRLPAPCRGDRRADRGAGSRRQRRRRGARRPGRAAAAGHPPGARRRGRRVAEHPPRAPDPASHRQGQGYGDLPADDPQRRGRVRAAPRRRCRATPRPAPVARLTPDAAAGAGAGVNH